MFATMRAAVQDAFAVIGQAGRLLVGHWPVLLAILFAGEAGRYAALWAAVEVSDISGTLGVLILALGPLAAVSALIAALYALRHSLPSLGLDPDPPGDRDHAVGSAPRTDGARGILGVLSGVMVPFLAIYASYGYLAEDIFRFVNAAVAAEMFDVDVFLGTEEYDAERTALATGWAAMVVVAVAIVVRHGLGMLAQRRHVRGLAWAAAYVEVLWLATLARMLAAHQEAAMTWVEGRSVVQGVVDLWESAVAVAGPVGAAFDAVVGRLLDLLGSADALLVVPVAWLAVGAVVYGHELGEPVRREPRHRRVQPRVTARAGRMGQPVRRVGNRLTGGLGDRFGALGIGFRRLAVAGLRPMLLFAVAFVVAQRLEHLVSLGLRNLLGPVPLDTYLAFAPQLTMVAHVVGTVVVVCLLAAAIDRVLDRGARPPNVQPAVSRGR